MTWRSDHSRSGVPSVPRKYFWATMLVAFSDQDVGNSTPAWKKASPPSLKLGIRASRRSQAIDVVGIFPDRGEVPSDPDSQLLRRHCHRRVCPLRPEGRTSEYACFP